MHYLQSPKIYLIEKNSLYLLSSILLYVFLSSIIFCTLVESIERFFPLASQLSLLASDYSPILIWLFVSSESSLSPLVFLAVTRSFSSSFRAPRDAGRPADAVCLTRAFAFSSRVTEHSIVPIRTTPSGRPELARVLSFSLFLSTSRSSGSYPACSRTPPRHTPAFHSFPTRIGNQFRKTVINGRQRTFRAPGAAYAVRIAPLAGIVRLSNDLFLRIGDSAKHSELSISL